VFLKDEQLSMEYAKKLQEEEEMLSLAM